MALLLYFHAHLHCYPLRLMRGGVKMPPPRQRGQVHSVCCQPVVVGLVGGSVAASWQPPPQPLHSCCARGTSQGWWWWRRQQPQQLRPRRPSPRPCTKVFAVAVVCGRGRGAHGRGVRTGRSWTRDSARLEPPKTRVCCISRSFTHSEGIQFDVEICASTASARHNDDCVGTKHGRLLVSCPECPRAMCLFGTPGASRPGATRTTF